MTEPFRLLVGDVPIPMVCAAGFLQAVRPDVAGPWYTDGEWLPYHAIKSVGPALPSR